MVTVRGVAVFCNVACYNFATFDRGIFGLIGLGGASSGVFELEMGACGSLGGSCYVCERVASGLKRFRGLMGCLGYRSQGCGLGGSCFVGLDAFKVFKVVGAYKFELLFVFCFLFN